MSVSTHSSAASYHHPFPRIDHFFPPIHQQHPQQKMLFSDPERTSPLSPITSVNHHHVENVGENVLFLGQNNSAFHSQTCFSHSPHYTEQNWKEDNNSMMIESHQTTTNSHQNDFDFLLNTISSQLTNPSSSFSPGNHKDSNRTNNDERSEVEKNKLPITVFKKKMGKKESKKACVFSDDASSLNVCEQPDMESLSHEKQTCIIANDGIQIISEPGVQVNHQQQECDYQSKQKHSKSPSSPSPPISSSPCSPGVEMKTWYLLNDQFQRTNAKPNGKAKFSKFSCHTAREAARKAVSKGFTNPNIQDTENPNIVYHFQGELHAILPQKKQKKQHTNENDRGDSDEPDSPVGTDPFLQKSQRKFRPQVKLLGTTIIH